MLNLSFYKPVVLPTTADSIGDTFPDGEVYNLPDNTISSAGASETSPQQVFSSDGDSAAAGASDSGLSFSDSQGYSFSASGAGGALSNFNPTSLEIQQDGVTVVTNAKVLNISGATVTNPNLLEALITIIGGGDSAVDEATRTDDVGGGVVYIGKAAVGSSESSAVWKITKLTEASDGDVTIEYADGDALYNNIWDNRVSLSYT